MICKWCGAKVDVRRSTCPVCGRETPPLSDCGGIYNLAQGFTENPAPPEVPAKRAPDVQAPPEGRQSASSKKRSRWPFVCGMALLLVSVALLVSLKVDMVWQGNDMRRSLHEINASLSNALEDAGGDTAADVQAAPTGNGTVTPSPEPSESLAPQALSFELNCISGGAIQSFTSTTAAELSVEPVPEDQDRTAFNVQCELNDQPWDSWDAKVEADTTGGKLRLSCVLEPQSEVEAKSTSGEWYYKVADDGEWVLAENAGEEGSIALDGKGNLLVDQSDIPQEIGDEIMVKYTYQVTNAQRDTLKVDIIQTVPVETV